MKRVLMIVLGLVLVVAVAAGSFYGGTVYGKNQARAQLAAARQGAAAILGQGGQPLDPAQAGQGGAAARRQGALGVQGGPGGQGGGVVFGEITEVKAGVLVITDNNGKQTQVTVTDTTLIEKNASVSLADLKQGETVIVSGSAGSDGSVTARSVQVSPAGRMGIFNAAPGR